MKLVHLRSGRSAARRNPRRRSSSWISRLRSRGSSARAAALHRASGERAVRHRGPRLRRARDRGAPGGRRDRPPLRCQADPGGLRRPPVQLSSRRRRPARSDPPPPLDARRLRLPPARRNRPQEPRPGDDPRVRPLPRLLLHESPGRHRPGRPPRAVAPPREARLRARGGDRRRPEGTERAGREGGRADLRPHHHERLLGARAPDGRDEALARARQGQGLRDRARPVAGDDRRARAEGHRDAERNAVGSRDARVR